MNVWIFASQGWKKFLTSCVPVILHVFPLLVGDFICFNLALLTNILQWWQLILSRFLSNEYPESGRGESPSFAWLSWTLGVNQLRKAVSSIRSNIQQTFHFTLAIFFLQIIQSPKLFLRHNPSFHRRRMVASIMLDIQQYQNQPYNFLPVNEIQYYLTHLNPMGDMNAKEFQEYVYNLSLEVEPRHVPKPAVFVS